ncbi:hypothetical protein KC19_VG134600 [Ceratodon purpureus]|nr:hypothetical protein KC19_VG134600 [Ceratodon purpureus]KAG0572925.1 hypothetical protein KC19_VG134600 [Ceratodon purpureus]
MDSKEQNGKKVYVKESIKYVSDLIADLGLTGISPEKLRLAKFNSIESSRCLFHSLHSILNLVSKSSMASSTTSCNFWREQVVPQTVLVPLESVSEASSEADILGAVKFYFALWRYPPHSPFFTQHAGTHESRHFLLALGWILSRCNLIERALEHRLLPLLAARNAIPLPHVYPLNMSSCPKALARANMVEWAALDYVRRMNSATVQVENKVLRTEMRADQVLILHGQVRACLNAIQALQKLKVKKLHELHLAQLIAGESQPHIPYELHILQHRKTLDFHCHAIAAARAVEDEKEVCRKHEDLFWQWMESVANKALAVHSQSLLERAPAINLTGVTETELLPAVEHLKQESAPFEPQMEGKTSSCTLNAPKDADAERTTLSVSLKRDALILDSCSGRDNTLPQHAQDVAKCLLRPPVFVYEPMEKQETRIGKVTGKNEENDPQNVSFRIQRVTEVDEMVEVIFARTHSENK